MRHSFVNRRLWPGSMSGINQKGKKKCSKVLLISLFGIIWKHMTCLPFILGHTHTINPELKHSIKRVCIYTHTQAKGGGTARRSKVSAFQSDQIQAESYDCSDDKFINKQISTSRPIRHSITMATWPIIFCPTENHSVIG